MALSYFVLKANVIICHSRFVCLLGGPVQARKLERGHKGRGKKDLKGG